MTADEVLRESARLGILLSVTGDGKLHVDAPIGAVSPELKAELQTHRDALVYRYEERAAIMEFDGGHTRCVA